MASAYTVQIIDNETGEVVYAAAPGLAAEVELIQNLAARVKAKGVGLFRSADHVAQDVREALNDLLLDLKRGVPPKRLP